MMKVSDPILFGHAVEIVAEATVFEKARRHVRETLASNPNFGIGDLENKIADFARVTRRARDQGGDRSRAAYAARPPMYMVELRQGDHQPACFVGCYHRRLDARADPGWWQGLGSGRERGGFELCA